VTSDNSSIVASGSVFTAGGVDIGGRTADTVRFPGGTFTLTHSAGRGEPHFSPRTCLMQLTLRGTYTIGHGTGRYAGISGHGRYVARILNVARRVHGKCSTSQRVEPAASQTIINAQGPLRL
jgi:hypothetical protein